MKSIIIALVALALLATGCVHSNQTFSGTTKNTEASPTSENHWHIPIGFYICGEFRAYPNFNLPHPPNGEKPFSFKDGVLHVSPTPDTNSDLAFTLGTVANQTGFFINDDTISFFTQTRSGQFALTDVTSFSESSGCLKNGTQEPAVLSAVRWQLRGVDELQLSLPEIITENLAGIDLTNNFEAYTIALLPPGSPTPPIPISALNLLKLPEAAQRTDIPTPSELMLVPNRVEPPALGSTLTGNITCPTNASGRVTQFPATFVLPNCIDSSKTYTAIFETNLGNIEVSLNTSTRNATNAFILLAQYHYYDGSALFRTDPRQGIIQGGAPHTNQVDDSGPGFIIPDDAGNFTYESGQLIMARNQSPNSANGQFIFTVNDKTRRLAASETTNNLVVFGEVTQGIDILRKIMSLHAEDPQASEANQLFLGGPIRPIIIQAISITSS